MDGWIDGWTDGYIIYHDMTYLWYSVVQVYSDVLSETLQAGSSKSHKATSLHSWQPNMAMRTHRKMLCQWVPNHLSMIKSPLFLVKLPGFDYWPNIDSTKIGVFPASCQFFFSSPGAPIHLHGLSLQWQSLRRHHHPGSATGGTKHWGRWGFTEMDTLLVLDWQFWVKRLF